MVILLGLLSAFLGVICIRQYICKRRFFKHAIRLMNRETLDDKIVHGKGDERTRILRLINYSNRIVSQHYEMRLMQQNAELRALQNQINPHFLYNTLDTIRGKAYEEKAFQTAQMIELLAQMFRYTIGQNEGLVMVEEEIANVETYISIQQYRFRTQYTLEKIVDDSAIFEMRIPRLTLQPIVENSIRYGLKKASNNIIRISLYSTQNKNVISIADNGCGMSEKQLLSLQNRLSESGDMSIDDEIRMKAAESGGESENSAGTSIALVNVNARLKLTFGDEYGLHVHSAEGIGTEVVIHMPNMQLHNYNE